VNTSNKATLLIDLGFGFTFYFVPAKGTQWRIPLAIQAIPPLILAIGILFLPEHLGGVSTTCFTICRAVQKKHIDVGRCEESAENEMGKVLLWREDSWTRSSLQQNTGSLGSTALGQHHKPLEVPNTLACDPHYGAVHCDVLRF
jgi:hypothetical protein